jgi:hypothetical protein
MVSSPALERLNELTEGKLANDAQPGEGTDQRL